MWCCHLNHVIIEARDREGWNAVIKTLLHRLLHLILMDRTVG